MSESRDQNRIQPVDPAYATGAIRRLFSEIRAKFALVPNLFRVLANAPVALEGLMGLGAALALNIFENYMSHVARVPIDFPQHEFRERSGQENESNGQGRKV
jgi:hypothetical protein